MIVPCPRCEARYPVDEEVVRKNPTFRCSRCDHMFSYEAAAPETKRPARRRPEEDSLSFSFEIPSAEDRSESREVDDEALDEEDELPEDEDERGVPDPEGPYDQPDDFSAPPEPVEPEGVEEYDAGYEERPAGRDFEEAEPRFARTAFATEEEDEERRPFPRTVIVFLGALLLVYGNLALYLRSHPSVAEARLTQVPLLGSWIAEDGVLRSKVSLENLRGGRVAVQGGRHVFLVSGRAINASERSLQGIQVEAVLYDQDGRALTSQRSYCGNVVSRKIVENVSEREISILQNLEPPKRFSIRPGESTGFSVVFLDPPPTVRQLSVRVASAQAATTPG